MDIKVGDKIKWKCHYGNQYSGIVKEVMSNVVVVETASGNRRYIRRDQIINEKSFALKGE